MDLLITPFSSNGFMLQALIAGILVSIACAIAGTFVILRGLAFIGDETGVQVVELTTHALLSDGSYFTFIRNLTTVITNALK